MLTAVWWHLLLSKGLQHCYFYYCCCQARQHVCSAKKAEGLLWFRPAGCVAAVLTLLLHSYGSQCWPIPQRDASQTLQNLRLG